MGKPTIHIGKLICLLHDQSSKENIRSSFHASANFLESEIDGI